MSKSGIWERRNIGRDPYYYDVLKCKRVRPLDPGDCDECGGPCIITRRPSEDSKFMLDFIIESCMFCGMEYMKWER